MKFKSLNKKSKKVKFSEAVISGLAPDKGLYFPDKYEKLNIDFYNNIEKYSDIDIAYKVLSPFVGDCIPKSILKKIISETLSFQFPIIDIEKNICTMELFHGPTFAFKDVGARFMARCLGFLNSNKNNNVTVLVATSGDTGGAVADGFLGVKGINVVILYPKGKVSYIQEKQITTLGKNITAIEVKGTFDDCQEMVKSAFLDQEIISNQTLTSANSINIARWLPQMLYYFFAFKLLKNKNKPIVISVPSGNFGNLCAGILSKKIGLPIDHFIASTNINDVIPIYLSSGKYTSKKSKETISNAMDVGDPSNFIRILKIYDNNLDKLKKDLSSYSFNDLKTINTIKEVYDINKYILDPHGAVGYLGLKKYLKYNPNNFGLFMETAHPVKFSKIVEKVIDKKIPIPERLKRSIVKKKKSIEISKYEELRNFLIV